MTDCVFDGGVGVVERIEPGQAREAIEVDRHQIVLAALDALAARGAIERSACARAIARYGIDAGAAAPWAV